MQVSIATQADIPGLVEVAKELIQSSQYKVFEFSAERMTEVLLRSLKQDPTKTICLVGKVDKEIVGTIAGVATQPGFSNDYMATEWLWGCKPEYGKRKLLQLLEGFEFWAKNVAKCKVLQVGQLHFKNAPNSYWTRHNFVKSEEYYIKDLTWEPQ
jgi:hypothetical protein